jgi:regulator of replication initiation timing
MNKYGYKGSRSSVENWNTTLRRENQKLKERLAFDAEFEKFLKDNDLECLIFWDRFQWEVKIFREWLNEAWSVVKYHKNLEAAKFMALSDAKIKAPKH